MTAVQKRHSRTVPAPHPTLLLPLRANNQMFLLLAVNAQPKQIGATIMTDAIHKTFTDENGVEVQIGVDDAFFGLVHVFGEFAAVGPKHGATSTSGTSEKRRSSRA